MKGDMIRPAAINQDEFAPLTRRVRSVCSGSQIPSSIVMPGFSAPGLVAVFRMRNL
jgi:hypothetical protein